VSVRPAIFGWLPGYHRSWLRLDAISGLTVAAVLIPTSLSYAVIVGAEPIVGLYTVPFALVAYAIFGGSRLLVVGPDAALSVLAATTIASVATGDDFVEVMVALSLIVGAVFGLFSLLKMGWIADVVPDPVLKAFIQGLVWVTILDQVPALVGVSLDEDYPDIWRTFAETAGALGEIQAQTAILGIGSLVALVVLRRIVPRVPGPLVVLVASMVIVAAASLADDGVAVIGEPDGGFFNFGLPTDLAGSQWVNLIPGAIAIVVLGFTESMGAAKSAAQKTGERLDPNEELLALGTSNVGSGLAGGFVVTGALSKTSVAIASGGKTQIGNLLAAAVGVLAILVLRPLFEDLASAVLSALIIFAMAGMLQFEYFVDLWKISRVEFVLAAMTFLGVLTFGVLPGVMLGVVLALVLLMQKIGRPAGSRLGLTADGQWHSVQVASEAREVDGLVVYRQEAPVVFLNARSLTDELRDLATEEVQVIVFDALTVSSIDSTGFAALSSLSDELASRGIELWAVNPSIQMAGMLDEEAAVLGIAMPRRFQSLDEAVAAFDARPPS
jgi:high affinity sulfate transporter 1